MQDRESLNALYMPLYEAGVRIARCLRAEGFTVDFGWCNMHEVKVGGEYMIEYFPLPELDIGGMGLHAELGIALDGGAWLELALDRGRALELDYALLSSRARLEVYGAENYLCDFLNESKKPEETRARITESEEKEIHLLFYMNGCADSDVRDILELLRDYAII